MDRLRPARRDSGETLVEILIAIIILAIASTGLIAGLSSGVFASDAHRRLSTGETVMRAYSELVKNKVLHPISTTSTADYGPWSAGDTITIPVASTTGFVSTAPYNKISFDGSIVQLSTKTATTLTGMALSAGYSRSGAVVERYESCPDAGYWSDVLSSHPELSTADRLAPPTITAVTFYDSGNNVTNCASYHTTSGLTACPLTSTWSTDCDPPWMKISLQLVSTDTGRSKTTLTSDVIIRRVP